MLFKSTVKIALFFVLLAQSYNCLAHDIANQNSTASTKKVDFVILSCDRPIQLFALLESMYKFMYNMGEIHVIYRTSEDKFDEAYFVVQQYFPEVVFLQEQRTGDRRDLEQYIMQSMFESKNDFVSIAVDDIIITKFIDIGICIDALEKTKAHGFYLRLGQNITRCFSTKSDTPIPPMIEVSNKIFSWRLIDGDGDWCWGHTLDMCLYKKSDISKDFEQLSQSGKLRDTHFEARWQEKLDKNSYGLCFDESKIINITANIVQPNCGNFAQFSEEWNKIMPMYSSDKLLEHFNSGMKIDIEDIALIKNNAPHVEHEFKFIAR